MKVGDRIRVFEIQKAGCDLYAMQKILGYQRPEDIFHNHFVSDFGVDLISKDLIQSDYNLHFNIADGRNKIKHVATMVITKIKQ